MSTERPFLAEQPKDGEIVFLCAHAFDSETPNWRWLDFGAPAPPFTRPDGSTGHARWMILCPPCDRRLHERCPGNVFNLADVAPFIAGDGEWQGDAPVIREVRGDA